MSSSNSLDSLHLINQICNDFEDRILQGENPELETAIAAADETLRPRLLTELLCLELFYLRQDGKSPDARSYIQRFPNHQEQVLLAFDKSSEQALQSEIESCDNGGFVREQGDTIGSFKIEKVLGTGAFAEVYLAFDERHRRPVAVKAMKPLDRDSDQELWSSTIAQSFVEEADVLRQLSHPAIAEVYDLGEDENDLPFVVMEYVKGTSLSQLLIDDSIDKTAAMELLADVAESLAYVHQQDVFHRDLKPSNIIVGLDNLPRIVDFGLAVQESGQRERKGEVAGSIAYMSPEQIRGQTHRLDGRTDIWAMGVILYEVLTGRKPFGGRSRRQIAEEILKRAPRPPRQVDDSITQGLENICLKALQKDAQLRYTNAGDFANDLRNELESFFQSEERRESNLAKSAHGRAELRLASQARFWNDNPEKQRLPTFRQFVQILLLTRPRSWTRAESDMMRSAVGLYTRRTLLTFAAMLLTFGGTGLIYSLSVNRRIEKNISVMVKSSTAENFNAAVANLIRYPKRAIPSLISQLETALAQRNHNAIEKILVALYHDDHLLGDLERSDLEVQDRLYQLLEQIYSENMPFVGSPETTIPAALDSGSVVSRLIDSSDGMLTENFAFCARLPREQYDTVSSQLAESGYEVTSHHQYTLNGQDHVAAVWLRGGLPRSESNYTSNSSESLSQDSTSDVVDIVDEVNPDYFGNFAGLGNIRIRISNEPISNKTRFERQIRFARKILAHDEIDLNARFMIARAKYYLGEIDESLNLLDVIGESDPGWLKKTYFLELKAMARARAGNYQEALWDVESLKKVMLDDRKKPSTVEKFVTVLKAKLATCSDNPEKAFFRLEELIKSRGDELKVLFSAARAYSVASEISREQGDNDEAAEYRKRAVELLEQLFNKNNCPIASYHQSLVAGADFEEVRNDINLEDLTGLTAFVASSAHWKLSSLGIYQPKIHSDSREHLKRCIRLAKEGTRYPLSIVAEQFSSDGTTAVATIWSSDDEYRLAFAAAALSKHQAVLRTEVDTDHLDLLAYWSNPSLRTELIHSFAKLKFPLDYLLSELLDNRNEADVAQALILAIGDLPAETLQADIESVENTLLEIESANEDSGVNSAIIWLRKMVGIENGNSNALVEPKSKPESSWYTNCIGQTMTRVNGHSDLEFWISATELTIEQFKNLSEPPEIEPASVSKGAVVNRLTWYDAAALCNAISKQAGIPETQWCFQPNEEGKYASGMKIKPDFMQLRGYRLATPAEWESACRAGSSTTWYHGNQEELLRRYAWYLVTETDKPKARPAAQLLPNRLGLFDMLGNLWEWTIDPESEIVHDSTFFVLCGGSSWFVAKNTSSNYKRPRTTKDEFSYYAGLRVVRRFPE